MLGNFLFKIITKIIATRLGNFVGDFMTSNQFSFIKGRSIHQCIAIASDMVNVLDKSSFRGAMAIKVDIQKAFDTMEWGFLLNVLRKFGFCETFVKWIFEILSSSLISVLFNGEPHGYFSCSRGVKQGDPLSPILFCLAEEVISRIILLAESF